MAARGYTDDEFVHLLDPSFCGYPNTKTVQDIFGKPTDMPVAPLQYLNSHDHSHLIAFVGGWPSDILFADRSRSYKLQPFVIALYTCQGTPMLWQGQEFADNTVLPPSGDARIHFRRNVHWEYFYDESGTPLVRLHRRLGALRHAHPALRSRQSFYDNVNSRPANGIVVYHRRSTALGQIAIVFLNFTDQEQNISVPFPDAGTYLEMLDDDVRSNPLTIPVQDPNQFVTVAVPSNYGYIFVKG